MEIYFLPLIYFNEWLDIFGPLGQRFRAIMLPKGSFCPSWATKLPINVARELFTVVTIAFYP